MKKIGYCKAEKYLVRGPDYHWKAVTGSKIDLKCLARYNLALKALSPELKGCRVLDAGCGDGVLSYMLAREGAEVYGIDISREALRVAKKRCGNARFYQASIYNLPFPDKFFDHITCLEVIEHLADPDKALTELKRVWKGSGKIVITTPIYHGRLNPYHVKEYAESEFLKLIRRNFPQERFKIIKFGVFLPPSLRKFKIFRYSPISGLIKIIYRLTKVNLHETPLFLQILPKKHQAAIIEKVSHGQNSITLTEPYNAGTRQASIQGS